MPCAVSCTRGATLAMAVAERPHTMGVMSTTCAITMAGSVYKRRSVPSGPERDSMKNTTRPASTGGRPMSVFNMRMTRRLPGNRYNPTTTPSGTPIAIEMVVEKAAI